MIDLNDLDAVVKHVERRVDPPPFHVVHEQARKRRRTERAALTVVAAALFIVVGVGAFLAIRQPADTETLVTASPDTSTVDSGGDPSGIEQVSTAVGSWTILSWSDATEEERLILERDVANVTFREFEGQPSLILRVPCTRAIWNITWGSDGFTIDDLVPLNPPGFTDDISCEEPIKSLEQLPIQQSQAVLANATSDAEGQQTLSLQPSDRSWFLELWKPAPQNAEPADPTAPENTTTTAQPTTTTEAE